MSSSFRKIVLAFAAAVLVTVFAFVRVAAAQTVQPAPGQADTASQEPTIRVGVDLVNILFTVRAKKGGQLIPNLEKSNFKVMKTAKSKPFSTSRARLIYLLPSAF